MYAVRAGRAAQPGEGADVASGAVSGVQTGQDGAEDGGAQGVAERLEEADGCRGDAQLVAWGGVLDEQDQLAVFGSKEDLVFQPMEEHFGDAARAVRERRPGESAVEAVRRQFVEMVEARDPSAGLHSEPFVLQVRRVITETPVLMERAILAAQRGTRDLAAALAEETGDPMLATIAAATLSAARNALIEEHHARVNAGQSADAIAAGAAERARRAFELIENGLKGYAVRA